MDVKLPMDTFENVMELAIEGCKAIANYIREVNDLLLFSVRINCIRKGFELQPQLGCSPLGFGEAQP
jgi:hypothetical protein